MWTLCALALWVFVCDAAGVRPTRQEHLAPEEEGVEGPEVDQISEQPAVPYSFTELQAVVDPQPDEKTQDLPKLRAKDDGLDSAPFAGLASFLESGVVDAKADQHDLRLARNSKDTVHRHPQPIDGPYESRGADGLMAETQAERMDHQRLRMAAILSTFVGAVVILRYHTKSVLVPRFAVEFLATLALCAAAYYGYLQLTFGTAVAMPFAYCVAIELLFGFDNAMDIVGWYMHSGLDTASMVRYILAGGIVQAVPRLTILPTLAHSLSHSTGAQHFAAMLLLLTAGRNIYVGLTYRAEVDETRLAKSKNRFAPVLPLALRIVLVELTDFCANADSFFAKALATDDELHISLSSLVTLFVPRALALLLLAHRKPQPGPMQVMLLVSGFMLLTLGAHIIVPAIPDLPNAFKLLMPGALYAYVIYLAVKILRESEYPSLDAPTKESDTE